MGQGLSPSAALKAAQAWLRTATRADLMAYSEKAVQQDRLAPVKLTELQNLLHCCNRASSLGFTAWHLRL